MLKYTKSTMKPLNVTADSLKSSTFPTVSASYPGCRCTAAGLSQQPSGPFILVIFWLEFDSSQPNFFAVWVCLGSKQGKKTKAMEWDVKGCGTDRKEEIIRQKHAHLTNICRIPPERPEQGCFWLQAHPQPATWTWLPSTTGPLLWDSEPQLFGAKPPKTPLKPKIWQENGTCHWQKTWS